MSPHPIHAAHPDHLIFLDLITQTIFGEENTDHEAPHYVVFSTSLLTRPS